MATLYRGVRPSAANIISGPGALRGFLVSHAQTTAQTLTFYDNTAASGTILAVVHLQAGTAPCQVMRSAGDAIRFSVGLSYAAENCELLVWAVAY